MTLFYRPWPPWRPAVRWLVGCQETGLGIEPRCVAQVPVALWSGGILRAVSWRLPWGLSIPRRMCSGLCHSLRKTRERKKKKRLKPNQDNKQTKHTHT